MATTIAMQFYFACCISSNVSKELTHFPSVIANPLMDEAHNTLLHYFAYEDQTEELRVVLSAGLDPNLRNKNGETALHWAAKMGCIAAATVLVENGIDVDAQDISGSTALHCAIENGIPELIPVLIGGGCNSLIADGDGKIALDIANENADINSEYFATQLLLERTTTVPIVRSSEETMKRTGQNNADTFESSSLRTVKKGDIVFVRRRKGEVADRPQTANESDNSRSKPKKRVLSAGAERSLKDVASALNRLRNAPAPLTPAEEEALQAWKKKKKAIEEARKTASKPPFYSRAAFVATITGAPSSAAGDNLKPHTLLVSASEPRIRPVSPGVSSKKHSGQEAREMPETVHEIDKPAATIDTSGLLSADIGRTPVVSAPPIDVDINSVCFGLEFTPTDRMPDIWMKIVSNDSLMSKQVTRDVATVQENALQPVNIDHLLELDGDKATLRGRSASPTKKPLWFVSRDPASHLERSPSPSATLRHSAKPVSATLGPQSTDTSLQQVASKPAPATFVDIQPYIPFLPSDKYARCLDVYVSAEVCNNCKDHTWLAWHDEQKYSQRANHALNTVLSTIVECGFPVRVFAYKVKADHTRLASLEINIALRTSHPNNTASPEKTANSHCPLESHLHWLSELSRPDKNQPADSTFEAERLQGLRGNRWATANLHSKLGTSRWPVKRQLQMRTVLFLASALCGIDFAMEYAKLIFFDKKSKDGSCGIGQFRKRVKKSLKQKYQEASATQQISEDEEELANGSGDNVISYQIDVVVLYRQWQAFTANSSDWKQKTAGYISADDLHPSGEATHTTASQGKLEKMMKFLEQRRSIRSKLKDTITAWQQRLDSRITAPDVPTSSSHGQSIMSRRITAAAAFLSRAQHQENKREFYSWGQFFDPTLTRFKSIKQKGSDGRSLVIGPASIAMLTRASKKASSANDVGKHIPSGLDTSHVSNALMASIGNLTTMAMVDIDVAQLHALWLYFVLDHTPCAALEYVPPFASRISTVVNAPPTESAPVVSTPEPPVQRVTLRIERKQSDLGLVAPITRQSTAYTTPNYLFDSPSSNSASALGLALRPVAASTTASPNQATTTAKDDYMQQLLTSVASMPVARSRGLSLLHVERKPSASNNQIAAAPTSNLNQTTVSSHDDDLLEQEYQSLVKLLDEKAVEANPAVPAPAASKGHKKSRHRLATIESNDMEDDEEEDDDNDDEDEEDEEDVDEDDGLIQQTAAMSFTPSITTSTDKLTDKRHTSLGQHSNSFSKSMLDKHSKSSPTLGNTSALANAKNVSGKDKRPTAIVSGGHSTSPTSSRHSVTVKSQPSPRASFRPATTSGKNNVQPTMQKIDSHSGLASSHKQLSANSQPTATLAASSSNGNEAHQSSVVGAGQPASTTTEESNENNMNERTIGPADSLKSLSESVSRSSSIVREPTRSESPFRTNSILGANGRNSISREMSETGAIVSTNGAANGESSLGRETSIGPAATNAYSSPIQSETISTLQASSNDTSNMDDIVVSPFPMLSMPQSLEMSASPTTLNFSTDNSSPLHSKGNRGGSVDSNSTRTANKPTKKAQEIAKSSPKH